MQKAGISFATCRTVALLAVAYALYHGWADIFFIGEIIPLPMVDYSPHQTFILFRTVGFFTCFALARRCASIVNRRTPYLVCGALMLIGAALMLASTIASSAATLLQLCGAGAGGAGVGLASMLWFEAITLLKPLEALICYLVSALVAPSLITPLYTAGFETLIGCGLVLPFLSPLAIGLGVRFATARTVSACAQVDGSLIARTISLLSLFGFALAFREPMIGNGMFASGSYTAVGSLIMALTVLLGMALWGARFRLSFVCRILLPLTAVAFLLIPAHFPLMNLVSDTCGSACDELVKILCIIVLTHQCWRTGASALRLFGLAYGIHGTLVFLGGQAYLALMAQGVSDTDLSSWFSIVAALVIAATIFVLPNEQDLAPISLYDAAATSRDKPDETPDNADAARQLAVRFGLTARETEILKLILQGKSIDNIATDLVIARETVKTHRRNLFLKCSVHRDEELQELAKRG